MVDFKYHVVTIIAVLVTLAVGIILGSTFNTQQTFQSQQLKLIESIEKDVNSLKTQIQNQQRKIEELQDATERLIPWAIEDRLSGLNVSIIYKESQKSLYEKVWRPIVDAGGEVISVRIDLDSLTSESTTTKPANIVEELSKRSFTGLKTGINGGYGSYRLPEYVHIENGDKQAQKLIIIADEDFYSQISSALEKLVNQYKDVVLVTKSSVVADSSQTLIPDGLKIVVFDDSIYDPAALVLSMISEPGLYGRSDFRSNTIPKQGEQK